MFDDYYIERYVTISPFDPIYFRTGGAYIIRCADGRLLANFWKSREVEGGVKYCGKFSFDNGETWGNEFVMPSQGNLLLHGSRIILMYIVYVSLSDCKCYVTYSDDYCQTWSTPVRLSYKSEYETLTQNFLKMVDGTYIQSCWGLTSPPNITPCRVYVWRCPAGQDPSIASNWVAGGDIPKGTAPYLDEITIEEITGGKLFALIRTTTGKQYKSISEDKGVTWSTAVPTNLISADSPAYLQRLSWNPNKVVVIWNNSAIYRYPLTIAMSIDDCETWGVSDIITNPQYDVAYPCSCVLPNGKLIVTWWNHVSNYHETAESVIIAPRSAPPPPPAGTQIIGRRFINRPIISQDVLYVP